MGPELDTDPHLALCSQRRRLSNSSNTDSKDTVRQEEPMASSHLQLDTAPTAIKHHHHSRLQVVTEHRLQRSSSKEAMEDTVDQRRPMEELLLVDRLSRPTRSPLDRLLVQTLSSVSNGD